MTPTEQALLAQVRAKAPVTAAELGNKGEIPHEALYEALVRLEAMGLLRITVDHNGNRKQAMWELA